MSIFSHITVGTKGARLCPKGGGKKGKHLNRSRHAIKPRKVRVATEIYSASYEKYHYGDGPVLAQPYEGVREKRRRREMRQRRSGEIGTMKKCEVKDR